MSKSLRIGWARVVSLFLLSFHCVSTAGTKLPNEVYLASTIPDSMRKNAHAAIRYDDLFFEVTSIRDAKERIHRVVTVLDAEGRGFGSLTIPYDKFLHIDDLDMRILDASGKEIRSLSSSDIKDYAATGDYSLYDDNRVRVATMYHSTYPYTIEVEIVYEYNGYIGWPTWTPEKPSASVEVSQFRVRLPKEMPLRYWSKTERQPTMIDDGNAKEYTWTAKGLPPFENEPVGPLLSEQYECVRTAPTQFEIEGYQGDLSSWKSLGQWYDKLYQGRQSLPPTVQKEVDELVAKIGTPEERVRALYERLQSTTRYVSIQLGVGGWQPFDATFVSNHGYGDCKALSNYMVATLNRAGITAYPALVYGGASQVRIDPNFPCKLFNHVITCVPLEQDTMWLECTSQTHPAGHLGDFTENRYALVVTPKGGVLVKTPSTKASDNMQIRNATVLLSTTGTGISDIRTTFTGNQQDRVRDALNSATPKEREEWLREHIEIPTFNVQQTDFSDVDSKRSPIGFTVKLQLPRFATIAGTRLLFQPNLMEKRTYVPSPLTKRKNPIVHSYPYLDIDTVLYRLPEGFLVESLPHPVNIETDFAKYESSVGLMSIGLVQYCRRLEMNVTELPPEKYNEYRKFIQDCVQADKASMAIVKK